MLSSLGKNGYPGFMNQPIFLIGLRGSGKTTLGQQLANALNYHFVDTDILFVETEQRSIAQAVEANGWDYFRAQESALLKQVFAPNTVIATGGGIILAEENRRLIKQNGLSFFLSAPTAVLAERLLKNPLESLRPALSSLDLIDELDWLLKERLPFYLEASHQVIETNRQLPTIVQDVITHLQNPLLKEMAHETR